MSKFTERLRGAHWADSAVSLASELRVAADMIDAMEKVLRSLKHCGLVGDDEERREGILDELDKLQ